MKTLLSALFVLIGISFAQAQTIAPIKPPPGFGADNPAVTQDNLKQTVCVPNWSAKQRPPASITDKIKLKLLAESGFADKNPAHYELDHFHSIVDGGAPLDLKNLWLESYNPPPPNDKCGARTKDKLEVKIHHLMCAGTITLDQGRHAFDDWVVSYNKYVGPLACPGP